LAHGVRVRIENFGLLFFCHDGPKLTFVHTGSLIHPEFFSGQVTLREWLKSQSLSKSEEELLNLELKISIVLSSLVDKGLIFETVADT
jgi:hypothetical protein